MTQATIAKFKIDDYHRMNHAGILDGRKVELLEGVITEMAPQGTPHAYYSDESGDYLSDLLGSRAKIREAKPITLGNNSEPEPDIAGRWSQAAPSTCNIILVLRMFFGALNIQIPAWQRTWKPKPKFVREREFRNTGWSTFKEGVLIFFRSTVKDVNCSEQMYIRRRNLALGIPCPVGCSQ